jgi:hypothetical protein
MITKFINAHGDEVDIESISRFVSYVDSSEIDDNTMLFSDSTHSWHKASQIDDYNALKQRPNHTITPKREFLDILMPSKQLSLVLLGVSGLLFYVGASFLSTKDSLIASQIGYTIGEYFIPVLVIAVILQKTVLKKFSNNGLGSFAYALFFASLFYSYTAYEKKQSNDALLGEMASMLKSETLDDSSASNRAKSYISSEANDAQKMKPIYKAHIAALSAALERYSAESALLHDLIKPENLANKSVTKNNLELLNSYIGAINKYFESLESIYQKTLQIIENSGATLEYKTNALEGMRKGHDKNAALVEKLKNNQLALADSMKEILLFTLQRKI